jgi:hypothetical protein
MPVLVSFLTVFILLVLSNLDRSIFEIACNANVETAKEIYKCGIQIAIK